MDDTQGLGGRLQSIDEALTAPLTIPAAVREDARISWGSRAAQAVALVMAHSGDSFIWGGLMAAAWLLGEHAWRVRAILGAMGLLVVEVVVIGLKMVIRRRRPPGDLGRLYRRADPYSFPSGHAARAAMLCILAWKLGPPEVMAAIAIWSPLMVVSRIAIGIHYVFDVAAGIILGCAITAALLAVVPFVAARV